MTLLRWLLLYVWNDSRTSANLYISKPKYNEKATPNIYKQNRYFLSLKLVLRIEITACLGLEVDRLRFVYIVKNYKFYFIFFYNNDANANSVEMRMCLVLTLRSVVKHTRGNQYEEFVVQKFGQIKG